MPLETESGLLSSRVFLNINNESKVLAEGEVLTLLQGIWNNIEESYENLRSKFYYSPPGYFLFLQLLVTIAEMKGKLIVVVVIIIALLIGAAIFLRLKGQKSSQLTLIKETGEVSYKVGDTDFKPVSEEETLIANASYVKTGSEGLAHVILPDDSMISLSNSTEMQINYDASKTSILQNLGNAWYRVQKLAGRDFEVRTPGAVAAVRGTIFGADRGGTQDTIYITDGEIEIGQLEGDGKTANQLNLSAGKLVDVGTADKPLKSEDMIEIPQEKRDTPWFRRNEIINEEFKVGNPRDFIKRIMQDERIKTINSEFLGASSVMGSSDFLEAFQSGQIPQGGQYCDYINSADFDTALNELRANSNIFTGTWIGMLLENINLIKGACEDGVITEDEAVELQKLYQAPDLPAQTGLPAIQ